MGTKLITSVLIYCFIFQISFVNTGCSSSYPVSSKSELADCQKNDCNVLIKFKNGTETEVPEEAFCFLKKDEIDSCKIVKYHSRSYQRFWLKDSKTLLSTLYDSSVINPDAISHFYLVSDDNGVYRPINKDDVEKIQVRKPDGSEPDWPPIVAIAAIFTVAAVTILHFRNMFGDKN